MDTITQAVLGACVAEAGWRGKLGRGAITTGVICGLLPDLDVLSSLAGPWSSMLHHRGFTHSIFFAPLVAPFIAWLAWRLSQKKGSWLSWTHLCFWAVVTHPLLDLFTTYGTQLLFPFSNQRFSLDAVAVVDPLYTLPLSLALLLAFLFRKRPSIGRYSTQFMLVLTTGYLGLGYVTMQHVRQYATQQLASSFRPTQVRATPTLFNTLLWRVIARNQKGDVAVGLFSTRHPKPIQFSKILAPKHPHLAQVKQNQKMKLFSWFATGMISTKVRKRPQGGAIFHFHDQRFGSISQPTESIWGVRVQTDAKGNIQTIHRTSRAAQRQNLQNELRLFWSYLKHGPPSQTHPSKPTQPTSQPTSQTTKPK